MTGNVQVGIVVLWPDHARPSTTSGTGCNAARASNVIWLHPLLSANRTISGQRHAGINPRARQVLTVDRGTPSPAETAPVPPRSSIAVSTVIAMGRNIVRTVRTCQAFARCETTAEPFRDEIVVMDQPLHDSNEIIAGRLRAVRLALEFKSQVAFAAALGIEKNTYNAYETGARVVTWETVLLIRKKFRIPVEWIFFGEHEDELPMKVYRRIKTA
jgi:DNA-binding XRE family transcriptional regulator